MAIEINTLARPYAKAAFEYALQEKSIDAWSAFLSSAAFVTQDERTQALLHNPKVLPSEKTGFYQDILAPLLDGHRKNFLELLCENRRLGLLPHIRQCFADYQAEYEKTVDVTAYSFRTLTDAQKKALTDKLETRLQRRVKLTTEIDPTLIGGVVIRAGDLVIDGSLKGRLNKLREQLTA